MSRIAEFRVGHMFLTGFHEERGEVDPPDVHEPPMVANVDGGPRVRVVPVRGMRLRFPARA